MGIFQGGGQRGLGGSWRVRGEVDEMLQWLYAFENKHNYVWLGKGVSRTKAWNKQHIFVQNQDHGHGWLPFSMLRNYNFTLSHLPHHPSQKVECPLHQWYSFTITDPACRHWVFWECGCTDTRWVLIIVNLLARLPIYHGHHFHLMLCNVRVWPIHSAVNHRYSLLECDCYLNRNMCVFVLWYWTAV